MFCKAIYCRFHHAFSMHSATTRHRLGFVKHARLLIPCGCDYVVLFFQRINIVMGSCCSWKCFATGLLIGTLCFITIAMIGGLVAIPVIYVRCRTDDYHQVSACVTHTPAIMYPCSILVCTGTSFLIKLHIVPN